MKIDSYNFFTSNHDVLYQQYPNRYLVISDKKIVFDTDTMQKAIEWVDLNGMDNAIIQYCSNGTSAYTSSFCSQIIVK